MAGAKKLYSLKRGKLRMSWNKYNFYNMVRAANLKIGESGGTFFQQKWIAKGRLRGYHGEHVPERKWQRMFDRRLLSVVNMNPAYMARSDGSELAAGRGSGHEKPPRWDQFEVQTKERTPYMQMAFAPMERRLDIAVFRAMFATSARQARQFCVHRAVKVNGQIMPYPAYKLNPGDMFQVDPERVMWATANQRKTISEIKKAKRQRKLKEAKEQAAASGEPPAPKRPWYEWAQKVGNDPIPATGVPGKWSSPKQDLKAHPAVVTDKIKRLIIGARQLIQNTRNRAIQKKHLRSFVRRCRAIMKHVNRPELMPGNPAINVEKLLSELSIQSKEAVAPEEAKATNAEGKSTPDDIVSTGLPYLPFEKHEKMFIGRVAEEMDENPVRPDATYPQPWRPRPYMPVFSFIPQYLEVSPKICSAVYLRHPVARLGSAEVPTPYGERINQLAYNWYLRRR